MSYKNMHLNIYIYIFFVNFGDGNWR